MPRTHIVFTDEQFDTLYKSWRTLNEFRESHNAPTIETVQEFILESITIPTEDPRRDTDEAPNPVDPE